MGGGGGRGALLVLVNKVASHNVPYRFAQVKNNVQRCSPVKFIAGFFSVCVCPTLCVCSVCMCVYECV